MDPATIRDQIDRILQSQSFANKGQLRKLLEVLFKNVDSQDALNADAVIKELWPTEIRTKRSADVATEMNRLRHALESYYSVEGLADLIIISLPNRSPARKGSHERRWIVALPRVNEDHEGCVAEEQMAESQPMMRPGTEPQASPRTGLKTMGVAAALCAAFLIAALSLAKTSSIVKTVRIPHRGHWERGTGILR